MCEANHHLYLMGSADGDPLFVVYDEDEDIFHFVLHEFLHKSNINGD